MEGHGPFQCSFVFNKIVSVANSNTVEFLLHENTFIRLENKLWKLRENYINYFSAVIEKSHITVSELAVGKEQEDQWELCDSLRKRQSWTEEK